MILLVLVALSADVWSRSGAERAAFVRANPCPATGMTRGACPGHQVDHIKPICEGGRDERANMQWLDIEAHRRKTRLDLMECKRRVGNRSLESGP